MSCLIKPEIFIINETDSYLSHPQEHCSSWNELMYGYIRGSFGILDYAIIRLLKLGGDGTRSGYVQYVQGIQPNVPAHTLFIDI